MLIFHLFDFFSNFQVLNNKQHYLLYTLVLAIQPRMLVTLIEDDQKPGSLKQVKLIL